MKRIRWSVLSVVLLTLFSASAFAQAREITGRVTSTASGQPLQAAVVGLAGQTSGVRTNERGEFRIRVPDGDVTIVDMEKEAAIDANKLHSKNKPTPWHGWKVKGLPVCTIVRGHVQMRDGEPIGKPIGRMLRPISSSELKTQL